MHRNPEVRDSAVRSNCGAIFNLPSASASVRAGINYPTLSGSRYFTHSPAMRGFFHGALMQTVAVLFAREDSHYKTLPQCDVYDMARDARTYDGPHPVVAHPPCRAWAGCAALRTHRRPAATTRLPRCWSTQRAAPCGQLRDCRDLASVMPLAVGLWPRLNCGGATKRKRQLGFTWSDANPATCQTCPIRWPRKHTLFKAESARTTGHTSQKQSANIHRPI